MKSLYHCLCGLRFYPAKRFQYTGKRFGLVRGKYVECPSCRKKVWVTTLSGKNKYEVK